MNCEGFFLDKAVEGIMMNYINEMMMMIGLDYHSNNEMMNEYKN